MRINKKSGKVRAVLLVLLGAALAVGALGIGSVVLREESSRLIEGGDRLAGAASEYVEPSSANMNLEVDKDKFSSGVNRVEQVINRHGGKVVALSSEHWHDYRSSTFEFDIPKAKVFVVSADLEKIGTVTSRYLRQVAKHSDKPIRFVVGVNERNNSDSDRDLGDYFHNARNASYHAIGFELIAIGILLPILATVIVLWVAFKARKHLGRSGRTSALKVPDGEANNG